MAKRNSVSFFTTFLVVCSLSTGILHGRSAAQDNLNLKWSGYGQVQYDSLETGIDGFKLRRARLSLGWSVLNNLQCKIQVETLQTPLLLDFYIDWKIRKEAGLRFGQFKIPFSMENLQSSADLDTINRSLTVEKLCPGRDIKAKGRDIGAAIIGNLADFQYSLGIFNGAGINKSDNDSRKDYAARLVYSSSKSFSAGLSHFRGHGEEFPGREKIRTGVEAVYTLKGGFIRGEVIFGRDGAVDRTGGYVLAGIDLMKKKVRILARYDVLDMNRDVDGNLIDVFTLGAVWTLAKRNKILVNYERQNDREKDVRSGTFLAQFQVSF